jgi:arylsulfatase A-like enzyme
MPSTRRQFLQAGASAAATAAIGPVALAQAADRPNVLVIVVDTLRADHVYGRGVRTPNIDALAREGLRFTRAFPEAMPTVPARNSILAGRRMFPFRGWHDHRGLIESPGWSPPRDVSFTTLLRRAGYWTGYVTDNPFLGFSVSYSHFRRSFDGFASKGGQLGTVAPLSSVSARELRHWLHPTIRDPLIGQRVRRYLANGGYWHDDSRSFAARVFTAAARMLDVAAANRPFALVVDTYEPHEPWTPPRRYLDLYGDPDYHGPEPSMPRYMHVDNWLHDGNRGFVLRRMRALYAAEVTMTDRWLGILLERLHELALERDTVIVLVSDHGIQLGEHGWTGKISVALHPALAQVPLIIVDPRRRRAGESSDHFASTHDIAPTVLRMAGLRPPAAMTGADLSRFFLGGRPPRRPYAYGGYADAFYVRTDRWALMADNRPAGFKLFDLRRDSGEYDNVAARYPGVVDELYGQVLERAGGRLPYYG